MSLTVREAARIRRYFSTVLWIKHCADFYWLPTSRRVVSLLHDHKSNATVPRAAILIGTFRHPYKPAEFMDDLNDLIALLEHKSRIAA